MFKPCKERTSKSLTCKSHDNLPLSSLLKLGAWELQENCLERDRRSEWWSYRGSPDIYTQSNIVFETRKIIKNLTVIWASTHTREPVIQEWPYRVPISSGEKEGMAVTVPLWLQMYHWTIAKKWKHKAVFSHLEGIKKEIICQKFSMGLLKFPIRVSWEDLVIFDLYVGVAITGLIGTVKYS